VLCINDIGNFSTTSPGPIYDWDFGDQIGTFNINNPTYGYTLPGDFNIQLKVTDAIGCSESSHKKIHIDDKPQVPVITGATSVCAGDQAGYFFSQPIFSGANYVWTVSS